MSRELVKENVSRKTCQGKFVKKNVKKTCQGKLARLWKGLFKHFNKGYSMAGF
jgi:hypothetical protein